MGGLKTELTEKPNRRLPINFLLFWETKFSVSVRFYILKKSKKTEPIIGDENYD